MNYQWYLEVMRTHASEEESSGLPLGMSKADALQFSSVLVSGGEIPPGEFKQHRAGMETCPTGVLVPHDPNDRLTSRPIDRLTDFNLFENSFNRASISL